MSKIRLSDDTRSIKVITNRSPGKKLVKSIRHQNNDKILARDDLCSNQQRFHLGRRAEAEFIEFVPLQRQSSGNRSIFKIHKTK